jgi:predicted MFS family arabinose efflux permease
MFMIFGAILAGYGIVSASDAAMYSRSLGINVNLWWGLILLVFSAVMLLLARRAKKHEKPPGP